MSDWREELDGLRKSWGDLMALTAEAGPAGFLIVAVLLPVLLVAALSPLLAIGYGFWQVAAGRWTGVAFVLCGLAACLYLRHRYARPD